MYQILSSFGERKQIYFSSFNVKSTNLVRVALFPGYCEGNQHDQF